MDHCPRRRRSSWQGGIGAVLAAKPPGPTCAAALAVAAGYFVLATVGTILSVPPSGFSTIWPATPFLLSVLLLTPVRLWWIYPITVVPTHFVVVALFDPVSFVVAVTQIGGNFALAVSTALALRIIGRKAAGLWAVPHAAPLHAAGRTLGPAVVNSLIILVHMANGRTGDFWLSWGQWMMATVFPAVTIPPVLVPAIRHVVARWQFDVRFLAELGIVSAALVVLGFVAFGAADFGMGAGHAADSAPAVAVGRRPAGAGDAGDALLVLGVAIVVDALRLV